MSKATTTKITRQLLIDALVWNCPLYIKDGVLSRCANLDGTYSNCVGKSAQEIVNHIRWRACSGAWDATKQFVQQYKQYCKNNGLEAEIVTCRLN